MVKRKIIWSPRAKIDIFEILDFYYRRNGTKTYSVKLNSKIRTSVRLLENHYPKLHFVRYNIWIFGIYNYLIDRHMQFIDFTSLIHSGLVDSIN